MPLESQEVPVNDNIQVAGMPASAQLSNGQYAEFSKAAHDQLLEMFKDEIVPGPLNGMVVFSLEQQICGPFASRLLAGRGALVIKAEPEVGDSKRHNSSPNTFGTFNVGKKSITLGRDPQSEQLKSYMLHAADVVIDNRSHNARTHDKVLRDFFTVNHTKPKIYTVISGYGKDDPRIAYDRSIQAAAGYVDLNGGKAIPNSPTDMMVGSMAAVEILSHWSWLSGNLSPAEKDKLSQHHNIVVCDLPMINVAMFSAMNQVMTHEDNGTKNSSIVPYGYFDTQDGRVAIAIGTDAQFKLFCEIIGVPKLAEQYPTNEIRRQNQEIVESTIQERTRLHSTAEWVYSLQDQPFASAPVVTFEEAIKKSPGLVTLPSGGKYMATGINSNMFPNQGLLSPAPKLGEHTASISSALHTLVASASRLFAFH
ncbi:MAG: CaiB/BaiF CoA-transferase family protein [Alphaproteobacteria bacterium]|nr:CaiB/BaiF CoA-transferase family protein [Alphaproteobacteria bacterium]